jgi:hypothetical protein
MGGHLGGWGNPDIGQPERSDEQHHTLDAGAAEPDITPWAHRQITEHLDEHSAAARELADDPPETFEDWGRRQIEKLWYEFRHHGDDIAGIQAHLEAWGEAEIISHTFQHDWPTLRCGCGFIATAPDGEAVHLVLSTHPCPNRKAPPSLARLVVGCATFLIFVFLVGALIEDIMGVH